MFFVLLCHGNATKYNTLNGRCQFDFEIKENSRKKFVRLSKNWVKSRSKICQVFMKMNGKLDFQDYIIKFFMSLIYRKLLAMFRFLRHVEWIGILAKQHKVDKLCLNFAWSIHSTKLSGSQNRQNKNTRKLKSSKNPKNL